MDMYNISTATITDIPHLVRLVNSAYRGEQSKEGWTTEADLIQGKQRIDKEALNKVMKSPNAAIIKCNTASGEMVGCVYLKASGTNIYLGMLTVSPEIQAQGIGKNLLQAAEEYAHEKNFAAIVMHVISIRSELIDWYLRRGYHLTGESKPFHEDMRFGKHTQPLELLVLKKSL
jgi:ribosomal protein S18 acetylase RimI-like enzyme